VTHDGSRRQLLVGSAALTAAALLPRAAGAATPGAPRLRASLTIGAIPDDGSELIRIGEWMRSQHALSDTYGNVDWIQAFETRVAQLLGFEAGCFFPTGTMAQLIVLRLLATRTGSRLIGVHPSSHHVLHENDSLEVLHGLTPRTISPWERPISGEDVRRCPERLGAVSFELPLRWLGGALPTWEQLEELKAACRDLKIPLHMDGARLWECQPYYGKSLAEICRGFETVYVSMYKTIGALAGAVIVGARPLIAEMRMWRRRHGGDVVHLYPYVASAAMRLDGALARIPTWVERARKLATALRKDGQLVVAPDPVPTNMFRLYLRGSSDVLRERRDQVAKERGIWVAWGFPPARVPGFVECELQLNGDSDAIKDDEALAAVKAVISPQR
jgi:threonine aldolase